MEIIWKISKNDVRHVREFVDKFYYSKFVQHRLYRNVNGHRPKLTKHLFWQVLVSCLITTQQRSGPTSQVGKFISKKPFPLRLEDCDTHMDVERFSRGILSSFHLRRSNQIFSEIGYNHQLIRSNAWQTTHDRLNMLPSYDDPTSERSTAEFIANTFKGFGPKQSRNLLQSLGLSKYEIPIDSRIIKWLNGFGFPVKLSSNALADPDYYAFISEGVQNLCKMAKIYPCIFDAAIFVSYEAEAWENVKIIY